MKSEREVPEEDSIEQVFRELGLEDTEIQDHFKQLAQPSEWHSWRKSHSEPQETQNYTVEEREVTDAKLEPTS